MLLIAFAILLGAGVIAHAIGSSVERAQWDREYDRHIHEEPNDDY